ncbi:MAG: hypothetical protein QOJ58_5622, partial [Alphaproteobacteria bacterium]|nr:hypothetical protein [Alphaproteobacteria bacterium]
MPPPSASGARWSARVDWFAGASNPVGDECPLGGQAFLPGP